MKLLSHTPVLPALLLAAVLTVPVHAQPLPPLQLEQLLQQTASVHPMVQAMQAETEARQQQGAMARAVEAPMIGVEWRDIDSNNPTLNPTAVGSMRYSLRQMLPRWGERDLKSALADSAVREARAAAADTQTDLRWQLRMAWAEAWQAQQSLRINAQLQQVVQQMETAARQRYTLGMGSQADVLRVHGEQTMLRTEALQAEGRLQRARARLASLLGQPPDQLPEQDYPLPALGPLPPAADWLQRLEQGNASLQQVQQELHSRRLQQQLTELNGQPRVTLGAAAIQMEDRVPMVELMLEVQVPLQRRVLRAERDEAAAMQRRSLARLQAQRQMLEGEINDMLAMHANARAQQQLLDSTLRPQAELALQAALTQYQAGRGEFAMLLDAQQQLRQLQQMRLMSELEQFQAWAGLQKLAGE